MPATHKWQDALDQRIRSLPGTQLEETDRRGTRVYVAAGHYRLRVPANGGRNTEAAVMRDFDQWVKRAHLPVPTVPTGQLPLANGHPTHEVLAPLADVIGTDVHLGAQAEPAGRAKQRRTYQQCPVLGCGVVATGPHLAWHRRQGVTIPDGTAIARRKRQAGTPTPAPEPERKARVVLGAAAKAARDDFDKALSDVKEAVGMLQDGLTTLHDRGQRVIETSDGLGVENRELRRQVDELSGEVQGMLAAIESVKTRSGATRSGVPIIR